MPARPRDYDADDFDSANDDHADAENDRIDADDADDADDDNDAGADDTDDDDSPGNEERPDDDWLDDDSFPLGDGVADRDQIVLCPYCGEPNEIALDPGSGTHQDYVEDCQVCCQPWHVVVTYQPDGSADVHVDADDGR